MKFKEIADLPATIKKQIPEEAQKLYLEAYNNSWSNYDEEAEHGDQTRDAAAHRDAWAAVKREYVHDEERGIWYRHGEVPPEEENKGVLESLKDMV